jgi:glycosyltransferase involved in cell wall biosynthesis
MKLWHFVGDVFEWLGSRPHVSGVQRVALQLLAAGCVEFVYDAGDGACMLAASRRWLVPIAADQALTFFRPWLQLPKFLDDHNRSEPEPGSLLWPGPGEHVLFAGLVWTPLYNEIFRRLSAFDIGFSVLIHDLIPIMYPEVVRPEESVRFAEWLRVVLASADNVFVSTKATRDAITNWASGHAVVVKSRIAVVPFGTSHFAASGWSVEHRPVALRPDPSGFVLSVGTIDRRKNQAILLPVWARLIAEKGAGQVPKLVLAGRSNLAGFKDLARNLIALDKLIALDAATDQELAWLYGNCLFTVFPSICEGYGIPVAESLAFGKLCVASDLREIQEFAGDLVWYFDPLAEDDVYERVRLAIDDDGRRAAAEARIQTDFVPTSWSETLAAIRAAAELQVPSRTCKIAH